ncbi:MAG: hypothetical protein K9H16_06390 [Bacteroidales bacterium]|nr:hypothetical protein [Bacteroidales bacterium]
MYKFIRTDNPPLEDLKEVGKDLVIEIIGMLPHEIENNFIEMRNALQDKNYEIIERGAHSIKSNLKIFMDEYSPAVEFCYDFEKRANKLKMEMKENGFVKHPVDFTPDLEKLINITREPLAEIERFGEEYKNS